DQRLGGDQLTGLLNRLDELAVTVADRRLLLVGQRVQHGRVDMHADQELHVVLPRGSRAPAGPFDRLVGAAAPVLTSPCPQSGTSFASVFPPRAMSRSSRPLRPTGETPRTGAAICESAGPDWD